MANLQRKQGFAHTGRSWAGWGAGGVLAGLSLAAMSMAACNDRPVDPFDGVVSAVVREETALPPKTKLDFLFVIDNSASMCEEQANLTKNFKAFTEFLFDDLDAAADYRLAVISTDLANPADRGHFLYRPAPPGASAGCADQPPAETADCPANADPIIRAEDVGAGCATGDRACQRLDLERQFRCRATLGTSGDAFEKGLEALRLSLSCDGPNGALFAPCCVNGAYNPACVTAPGADEPAFLRPDAVLAVVIISDEDDCSDPAENPAASLRGVCRPGGTVDVNGDGLPESYADRKVCPDVAETQPTCIGACARPGGACDACQRAATEAACFEKDCKAPPCAPGQAATPGVCTTAAACADRCRIDASQNNHCVWHSGDLTPVNDYYNFLVGLKANPRDHLLVATLVGKRAYTEAGDLIEFVAPESPADQLCLDEFRSYDPGKSCAADAECPGAANRCLPDADGGRFCTGEGADALCCPEGRCVGNVQPSCGSANGSAFSGARYLALSEAFDRSFGHGVGCPEGAEGDPAACATICVDEFAGPLEAIREQLITIRATYCLDKPPACQVATDAGPRECQTAAERADPAHHPLRLRLQCQRSVEAGGRCQEVFAPRALGADEWTLNLNAAGCAGGAEVELKSLPPAGADVFVEYSVAVTGGSPGAQGTDAGAPPGLTAELR